MLRNNNIKNNILIFSFVFVFFGLVFGVGEVEAQAAPARCSCVVNLDDGKNCKSGDVKVEFNVPFSGSNTSILVQEGVDKFDRNICKDGSAIKIGVIGNIGSASDLINSKESCVGASHSGEILFTTNSLTTGSVKYNIVCSIQEETNISQTSGSSAQADCSKSPLGCNVNLSVLNKLNLKGAGGVQTLLGRAIKTMMGIVGSVALLMFVAGGFMWMTASGNAERTGKALKIITWSTLGIIVIFSAYVLVQFVFTAF